VVLIKNIPLGKIQHQLERDFVLGVGTR
jgi:hypothetical protein